MIELTFGEACDLLKRIESQENMGNRKIALIAEAYKMGYEAAQKEHARQRRTKQG